MEYDDTLGEDPERRRFKKIQRDSEKRIKHPTSKGSIRTKKKHSLKRLTDGYGVIDDELFEDLCNDDLDGGF
jgi:hypothetical protein